MRTNNRLLCNNLPRGIQCVRAMIPTPINRHTDHVGTNHAHNRPHANPDTPAFTSPVKIKGIPVRLLLDEANARGVNAASVEHGGGGLGGCADVHGGLSDRCAVDDVVVGQTHRALHPGLWHGQDDNGVRGVASFEGICELELSARPVSSLTRRLPAQCQH